MSGKAICHVTTYKRREKRLGKCLTISVVMASSNAYTMSDTAQGKGLAQLIITEPRVDAVPNQGLIV